MEIWLINWIPKGFILILGPLSLISIGYLVEKYYTGRITLFANAVALVTYFYQFSPLPAWLVLYINAVTILGLMGFVSYAVRFPLFELYYQTGRLASSFITGMILLWGMSVF